MREGKTYIRKAASLWCILLATSLILGYSIFSTFSGRIYDNAFESMNNNLQFAESSYDIFMNQMKMGMLQASVEPGIKELIKAKNGKALENLLREWGNHRYYVNEWYIVGQEGEIISSLGKTKNLLLMHGDKPRVQEIIKQALNTGLTVMGTELIQIDDILKQPTLFQYVAVPVHEDGGGSIGAIVTVMNLGGDNNITGKIMDDTGMYSVITAKDQIIATSLESDLYKFSMGSMLPEEISKKVLYKGVPYVDKLNIYNGYKYGKSVHFGAFRPINDIKGNIIGTQGIIYYDRLVETTLGQIADFTTIVTILLIAVFTVITWSYLKTQRIIVKEKQFSAKLGIMKRFSDLVRQASSEDEVYDILFETLRKDNNLSQIVIMRKDYNDNKLSVYKALFMEKLSMMKGMTVNAESCWALKSGKSFVHNNTNEDFNCKDFYSTAESYACLPVILGGVVSGVIQFQSDRKDYFTKDIVSEIKIYIDTITPVISNLRLLDSLNNLASMDALTKVYNRRYLTKYLEDLINASKGRNRHLCVIMLDIDFFKKFNDTYGHDAGDYVLMNFADTLKSNIREGDIVARYGGEEFVIVLPHTDLGGAYSVAEKLRNKVENILLSAISSDSPPKITCSLGISCYPIHGNNIDTLLQSADKALYEAKNSGRNRTCVFGEAKDQEVFEE